MELKNHLLSFVTVVALMTGFMKLLNPRLFAVFELTTGIAFIALLGLYSAIISSISVHIFSKNLKTGLGASTLVFIYYAVTGNYTTIFYGAGGSGEVLAAALSLLSVNIAVSGIEYSYRNWNKVKSALTKRSIRYSIYSGWMHTVFGFCLAIMTYGPEHINEFFFSLRFLTGFTGTFLLGAVPVYLYMKKDQKLPTLLTSAWIIWGIISFLMAFDTLPVSSFFFAPEFMIPPAPGYLFSSYLPLSLIIIYVAIRRADLNSYREKLQKYL